MMDENIMSWSRSNAELLTRFEESAALLRRLSRAIAVGRALDARDLKAGFEEDQPRWPKGTPEIGGRWSGGSGTQTVIVNNAQTGISTIDEATDKLTKTLAKVVDTLPKGSGPLYGIAVHFAFATALRLQNIRGIGFSDVETTWGGLGDYYGARDSIRTDVILRNDVGDPMAIYDVKTGNAKLSPSRVSELQEAVAPGTRIPVIEISVRRGVSLKFLSETSLLNSTTKIFADRLWE